MQNTKGYVSHNGLCRYQDSTNLSEFVGHWVNSEYKILSSHAGCAHHAGNRCHIGNTQYTYLTEYSGHVDNFVMHVYKAIYSHTNLRKESHGSHKR